MPDVQATNRIQSVIPMAAQAAVAVGQLWQLRNGRAGYFTGTLADGPPSTVKLEQSGQVRITQNSAVALLDGDPVYWDRTSKYATVSRSGANRGFFAGSVVGDSLVGNTQAIVDLNVAPRYDLDLAREPFTAAPIGTFAGGGGLFRRGGAYEFKLDATVEAQKQDALSDDGTVTGSKGIVEFGFKVKDGGASTHAKFYLGLASATHATDPSAVTEYVFLELDSNSTAINFLSADGTHSQAKIASGVAYTVGTRVEGRLDLRNPAAVLLYLNGVQVLAATTFNLSSGASNLFLLAWLGKTAFADTMDVQVDWLRARTAEQSVNGV